MFLPNCTLAYMSLMSLWDKFDAKTANLEMDSEWPYSTHYVKYLIFLSPTSWDAIHLSKQTILCMIDIQNISRNVCILNHLIFVGTLIWYIWRYLLSLSWTLYSKLIVLKSLRINTSWLLLEILTFDYSTSTLTVLSR